MLKLVLKSFSPTITSSAGSVLQGSWKVLTTCTSNFPVCHILEKFVCFCEFVCFNTFSDIIIDVHYWLRYKQRSSLNFVLICKEFKVETTKLPEKITPLINIYYITMSRRKNIRGKIFVHRWWNKLMKGQVSRISSKPLAFTELLKNVSVCFV